MEMPSAEAGRPQAKQFGGGERVRGEEPSPDLIHFGTAGRHPNRGEAGYRSLMFERKV